MTCWRGYRKNPQRNEVGMAEEKTFLIKIITPERVFYEGTAIMAEFNTSEGEIGVYAGHIPLTVILKPGVLTLTEESGKKRPRFTPVLQRFCRIRFRFWQKRQSGPVRSISKEQRLPRGGRKKDCRPIAPIRIWRVRRQLFYEPLQELRRCVDSASFS